MTTLTVDPAQAAALQHLLDDHAIRQVLLRYCRGIDRRQFDRVRSCYHPDAFDDHGSFKGGVDEFIAHCQAGLAFYERTMHFMGNTTVEVAGDSARSEAYTIAFHRLSAKAGKPARDHVVAFRYVDDFTRRAGEWRIQRRVCVFEWTRTDPVLPGWDFTPEFLRGRNDGGDFIMGSWPQQPG